MDHSLSTVSFVLKKTDETRFTLFVDPHDPLADLYDVDDGMDSCAIPEHTMSWLNWAMQIWLLLRWPIGIMGFQPIYSLIPITPPRTYRTAYIIRCQNHLNSFKDCELYAHKWLGSLFRWSDRASSCRHSRPTRETVRPCLSFSGLTITYHSL